MLKRIFVSCVFLSLFFLSDAQGYRIQVNLKNGKGYLYLGYYFGEQKYLQDSALMDAKGTAIFEGKKELPGGLYILVDPAKSRFFDVVIYKNQDFSVAIDTAFVPIKITGSPENDQLELYKQASGRIFKDYGSLQKELSEAKTKKDSAAVETKMKSIYEAAQAWRDSFIVANSESFLSVMFRLMREPSPKIEGRTKEDTLRAFYQFKEEYWKDISFSDIRLLRTPVFEPRLMKYLEQVVAKHPDSLKKELDRFILYSRTDTTMFKYFISRFTNEYMASKYMGLDVVFLHLFEKYYLTRQVNWLSAKDSTLIYTRAYNIMGNILGEPAAELNMVDTSDRLKTLYSIQSPYTLVVFWDPDCGHCREQVPLIDSLYNAAWKSIGMKLVGVLVDTIRSDKSKWPDVKRNWTKYIREHHLDNWIHLYQPFDMREDERKKNIPNFRQNYDVYQTPTIYLLDKDKRIVAKKISPEQIHDFLESQKNENHNHQH